MKAIRFLLLMLLFMGMQYSFAQSQNKHPVDKYLEDCLGHVEGQTTVGSTGCIDIARDKWEEEVQTNYKLLNTVLNDRQKHLLKTSFTEWLKYKESRFKLLEEVYVNQNGQDYSALVAEEKMEIVRQKALELADMYHTLKQ